MILDTKIVLLSSFGRAKNTPTWTSTQTGHMQSYISCKLLEIARLFGPTNSSI